MTGTTSLGNGVQRVRLFAVDNNTIGGTESGAGNLISGNVEAGVKLLQAADGNIVQGNQIGTDATGTLDRGNGRDGVWIESSSNNVIGGTAAGEGNLISGNNRNGILLAFSANGNIVQGNTIGTQMDGTTALGNNRASVSLFQASDTTIGGTAAGAGNIIAHSGIAPGVEVTGGTSVGNSIRHNSIFENGTLGIDIGTAGVTLNDPDDPDVGPNQKQNFPDITAAALNGGNLDITFSVPTTSANATFPLEIEFFITDGFTRSGKTFLGLAAYAEGTTPTVIIPAGTATAGTMISATATDANGNTSEFSNPATVSGPLRAAGRNSNPAHAASIDVVGLLPIVDAAISIWRDTGLTAEQLSKLQSVSVQISDLPGNWLGLASTHTITIDANAASQGWYVDPTPLDHSEFAQVDADALQQMDLLTTVLHEFGHILGFADALVGNSDIMFGWLLAGTRRLPNQP